MNLTAGPPKVLDVSQLRHRVISMPERLLSITFSINQLNGWFEALSAPRSSR